MSLEIKIKNQAMYLAPSIEEARFQLMQQLFAWQAIVMSLQRLESQRYQVGLEKSQPETYRNLLTKLPGGTDVLCRAYEAIDLKVKEVDILVGFMHIGTLVVYLPTGVRVGSNLRFIPKNLSQVKIIICNWAVPGHCLEHDVIFFSFFFLLFHLARRTLDLK